MYLNYFCNSCNSKMNVKDPEHGEIFNCPICGLKMDEFKYSIFVKIKCWIISIIVKIFH